MREPMNCPDAFQERWEWMLEHLTEQEMKALYAAAYRIVRNEADADDIFQESLIKSVKYIHHLRSISLLFSWMYKIVLNEAYAFRVKNVIRPDLLRKRAVRHLPLRTESVEQQAIEDDDIRRVKQALQSLSPDARRIIELHLLENLSLREVAAELQIHYHAARSRYRRALEALKKKMEEEK